MIFITFMGFIDADLRGMLGMKQMQTRYISGKGGCVDQVWSSASIKDAKCLP